MAGNSRRLAKAPGAQRTVTAEETIAKALPIARALGVTRLADITGLDRVGIPTWSAVVPRSDDALSVYNGKGMRSIDAKAGALMEAIERQTALKARLPLVEGSVQELGRRNEIIDPRDLREELSLDYSETSTYAWVAGHDLSSGREVLVPADYAGYLWTHMPHRPCHCCCSTNGIAAGNVREEAICQALCELIERDAWTLAEIGAHVLPWIRHRVASPQSLALAKDDVDFIPCLDAPGDSAIGMLEAAGLNPILHDITSDVGIPTVFAAIADEMIPGFPMVHCGVGTHPDALVAVGRAIAEAAQSRCVDIQGVREDIEQATAAPHSPNTRTRRVRNVNQGQWHVSQSRTVRQVTDLPSVSHSDVLDDLEYILARLRARGMERVIVVDFTPPDAPVSVVRAIVPELETWSLTMGPLGRRALEYWRRHA